MAFVGNEVLEAGETKKGWLINILPSTRKIEIDSIAMERSCLDLYFLNESGVGRFSTYVVFEPYFYVLCRPNTLKQVRATVERKFEKHLLRSEIVQLEDLDELNHLSLKSKSPDHGVLKLYFATSNDLYQVRKVLLPIVKKNQSSAKASEAYSSGGATIGQGASAGFFRSRNHNKLQDIEFQNQPTATASTTTVVADPLTLIVDLREFDVTYAQRVCTDLNLNCGCWFSVKFERNTAKCIKLVDCVDQKAEPVVLAFDLECTKLPLKFPDPSFDEIYMISYMVNRVGFLIINRAHVSMDVSNFEYTPKAEFPGPFEVFNVSNEVETLKKFFSHVQELGPTVFVTYNGDSFDFPFLEARALKHGMDLKQEMGISRIQAPNTGANFSTAQPSKKVKEIVVVSEENDDEAGEEEEEKINVLGGGGEYRGEWSVHIDCLYWVKRDSYLPAGSRSLKNVTKAKLGYDPVEVDPEEMMNYARERPEHMASYSVSDAVSTFYLYDKYIHLFVFSLCTIIPLGSEDVLRKGSGTLCESLLMVEAFNKHIICPNKQVEEYEKFYKGHLLESETYVGGHVECLESGVFREDIPIPFELNPVGFQKLRSKITRDLTFAIQVEGGNLVDQCTNFSTIEQEIDAKLLEMEINFKRMESPVIYHLDVGAMYPNIILTNRLQPCAIVDDLICASCDFNRAESNCKREMGWDWRGEMFPSSKAEYNQILAQLEYETVDGVAFRDLNRQEKQSKVKSRLKEYCQTTFKRTKDTVVEARKATICMRENPFYVDTVRAFRDRRNEYKKHTKTWSKKAKEFPLGSLQRLECETKSFVFDSLQLAHKCILNSFYGYVMRKGARWHSMEMAAVVTKTGSDLIKQARILVDQVGKPLELDTDGIWCVFPKSFPDQFQFEFKDGSKQTISYPCVMLNADVHDNFTNHQYQTLTSEERYETHSECSIFFELDGPYRCMVLPASQEEGKLLKKRYAVFNRNGTIAELKGFELKRRGELKIIKLFQGQVFEHFLDGQTLEECYAAVGAIANFWLDVLVTKGRNLSDEEVIDLISENRSMSRALSEYGDHKSTSITTAKRLGEFLGQNMVRDRGLACQLLIAKSPHGSPTTERAIPTLIFSASEEVRHDCLKRWLKDKSLPWDLDVREVIDWEYYVERLGKAIQKIISIPAALQRVSNPVPRIRHPDWLAKRVRENLDGMTQIKIDTLFTKRIAGERNFIQEEEEDDEADMEISTVVPTMPPPSLPKKELFEIEPFQAWLLARKEMWRERRRGSGIKRSKYSSEAPPVVATSATLLQQQSLTRFAQQQEDVEEVLQLLEVREEEPGVLLLIVGGEKPDSVFRGIRMTMQRVVYLSSNSDHEEEVPLPEAICSRTRVTHTLPRNRPYRYLYKLMLDEAKFRANGKELIEFFNRPCVEGVYERNIPLVYRAVSELGLFFQRSNTTTIKKVESKRNQLEAYESFSKVDLPPASSYLAHHRRVFLYQAGVGKRQILALFFVEEDKETQQGNSYEIVIVCPKRCSNCFIWFVGQAPETVNVEKIFADICREQDTEFSELEHVEVFSSLTLEEAWSGIRDVFSTQVKRRDRQLILVLQSSMGKSRILKELPVLSTIPCVEMASFDNEHKQVFPALLWRRLSCKRALQQYLTHSQWFAQRLQSSRFGQVPIAHLGEDHLLSLSDIALSRGLARNRIVSWASTTSSSPDLGGVEEDDVSDLIIFSEFENPLVENPGAYRSICVELSVMNLPMGALLNAEKINEIESSLGSNLSWLSETVEGSTRGKWTQSQGDSSRAFKLIRTLANMWYRDSFESPVEADKVSAFQMLRNVYRWVSSSRSVLKDSSIHRMMHALMSKLFYQLLANIKQLGGTVILASFERLIIQCANNRNEPEAAKDWVEHAVRTLSEQELFKDLQLEAIHYWHQYLFLDRFNFGGIFVAESNALTVTQEWNLVRYLPKELQRDVLLLLGEFIYRPTRQALFWTGSSVPLSEKDKDDNVADDDHHDDDDDDDDLSPEEQVRVRHLRKLVRETFTRRLLEYIPRVLSKSFAFPELPGSHLSLHNAALEVIKIVSHIFQLDSRVKDQVRIMKRQCLKAIRVLEFSPEAQFVPYSLELTLPDVICSSCYHCEDLDLCRDERLFSTVVMDRNYDDDEEEERLDEWTCQQCSHAYDKRQIEAMLIHICHRRCVAFQLQDLVCVKCRSIRANSLSEFCSCSGEWTWAQISAKDFLQSLKPFSSVANFYQLDWLQEVVQFAVQGPHVLEDGLNLAQFVPGHRDEDEGMA